MIQEAEVCLYEPNPSLNIRNKLLTNAFLLHIATNTDDFLIRMIKGCIQLSARPNINNTVNMVPVDHVARVVIAAAFRPPVSPIGVAQVTGHPRLRFNQFLGALQLYGYDVPQVDYVPWSKSLEQYVNSGEHDDPESQHALYVLFSTLKQPLPGPRLFGLDWACEDAIFGI